MPLTNNRDSIIWLHKQFHCFGSPDHRLVSSLALWYRSCTYHVQSGHRL